MKKGYQSEYEKLGKSLLEGKTISEITLKGKKYKFSYTTEEFIETARASKWPEELIILGKKYSLEDIAREYKDVQSKYISDFTSDFCLNSGGFGCSAYETEILNVNTGKYQKIGEITKPFYVLTTSGKKALALPPTKYEKAPLYKVVTKNNSFICTLNHRVLTLNGYKKVGELKVGDKIISSKPFCPKKESFLSSVLSYGLRVMRIVQGSQDDYHLSPHFYDEQSQSDSKIDQDVVPLCGDVQESNHSCEEMDALRELSHKYNFSLKNIFHEAKIYFSFLLRQNHHVSGEANYTLQKVFGRVFVLIQLVGIFLLSTLIYLYRALINLCNKFLNFLFSLAYSYPYSTITTETIQSITYERTDHYYDLHVLGEHNYLAEGVFHHNSGKSLALYVKLILLCKCFPGNRVLLGRKTLSDIDRAVLPELFDLMPSTWYEHRVKDGLINFNNGSQIILFGLDAMQSGSVADIKKAQQKLKSLNLGAYFIDQLEEVEYAVIEVLNSRLRRNEVPFRQGNSDCNPANFWAYHQFKQGETWSGEAWVPDTTAKSNLYESSMLYNPHLPGDYIRKQLAMGDEYVKRFVLGEWNTLTLLKGSVFAKEHRDFFKRLCKAPVATEEGCQIWEQPKNGYEYRMGVDPSEGIVDPSSITVVDNYGHKVAKFNGMITIQGLSDKIKFLYYKYKKPLIIPECNNSGTALIREIRDLNVYRRKNMDEKWDKQTEKLGFRTSWQTKQILISHFQELLRAKAIRIYDEKTINEMNTFLWNDDATQKGAGAARGFHDDDIMSTMLAFFEWTPQKRDDIMAAENKPKMMRKFQYL